MHLVVFATYGEGMEQTRLDLSAVFRDYLHGGARDAGLVVHHAGPTVSDNGETVTGSLMVLEAPLIEAAQAFVADSPYGQGGSFFGIAHSTVELVDGPSRPRAGKHPEYRVSGGPSGPRPRE